MTEKKKFVKKLTVARNKTKLIYSKTGFKTKCVIIIKR